MFVATQLAAEYYHTGDARVAFQYLSPSSYITSLKYFGIYTKYTAKRKIYMALNYTEELRSQL